MSAGEKAKPAVASHRDETMDYRPDEARTVQRPENRGGDAVQPPPAPSENGQSDADADDAADEVERSGFRISRRALEGMGAFSTSVIFHLVLFILLAIILVPQTIRQDLLPITVAPVNVEEEEERLDNQILDELITPSVEQAVAVSSEAVGTSGSGGEVVGTLPPPEVALVYKGDRVDSEFSISEPLINTPPSKQLIEELPIGTLGDARAVVDDYQEAMDRITRELLLLLDKHRVCVVWCFDRSESMKDDQAEIRDRIERVYAELGLDGRAKGAP